MLIPKQCEAMFYLKKKKKKNKINQARTFSDFVCLIKPAL